MLLRSLSSRRLDNTSTVNDRSISWIDYELFFMFIMFGIIFCILWYIFGWIEPLSSPGCGSGASGSSHGCQGCIQCQCCKRDVVIENDNAQ